MLLCAISYLGVFEVLAANCTSKGLRAAVRSSEKSLLVKLLDRSAFFRHNFLAERGNRSERVKDIISGIKPQLLQLTHLRGFSFEAQKKDLLDIFAMHPIQDCGADFVEIDTFTTLASFGFLTNLNVVRLRNLRSLLHHSGAVALKSALAQTSVTSFLIDFTSGGADTTTESSLWRDIHTNNIRSGNVFPISDKVHILCIRATSNDRYCPRVLGQIFNHVRALVVGKLSEPDTFKNISDYFSRIEVLAVARMTLTEEKNIFRPMLIAGKFPYLKVIVVLSAPRGHHTTLNIRRAPLFNTAVTLTTRLKAGLHSWPRFFPNLARNRRTTFA